MGWAAPKAPPDPDPTRHGKPSRKKSALMVSLSTIMGFGDNVWSRAKRVSNTVCE
jgi:hypothetical protein